MRDPDQRRRVSEIDVPPRDARSSGGAAQGAGGGAAAAKAAKRKGAQDGGAPAAPWFSSAGLRRRISFYGDQGDGGAPAGGAPHSRRASGRGSEAGAAARAAAARRSGGLLVSAGGAVLVALVVGAPLAMMSGPFASLSGAPTGGIAVWRFSPAPSPMDALLAATAAEYERTASGGGGMPFDDPPASTGTMAACAARAGAGPPVVLPDVAHAGTAPYAGPPPTAAQDPLHVLGLNCDGADGAACDAVPAATNAYEGGDPMPAFDLAEYMADWEAFSAVVEPAFSAVPPAIAGPTDLDSLALDCDATPDACAGVAAATNAYEGEQGAPADAGAAEAEAYLAAREAASVAAAAAAAAAPGSVASLALDCAASGADPDAPAACEAARAASNAYEDEPETPLARARALEDAVPEALPIDALGLDCWGASGDGSDVEPEVAAECARARGANSYEDPIPGGSGGHAHSHGSPLEFEIGADGLPVSGPVQGYYSWIPGAEPAHPGVVGSDAAGATPPAGYDLPAVEAEEYFRAAEAAAAELADRRAAAAAERQAAAQWFAEQRGAHAPDAVEGTMADEDASEGGDPAAAAGPPTGPGVEGATPHGSAARAYYKNPCNNPASRVTYKSPQNHPGFHSRRVYYKNPANAPHMQDTSTSPQPGAAPAPLPPVMVALVAGLAGAAAFVYLQGAGPVRRAAQAPARALAPVREQDADAAAAAAADSSRKATSSPSPKRADRAGGLRFAAAAVIGGGAAPADVDVVPSGTVDSPRRGATPQFGRSTTPLAGAGGAADAATATQRDDPEPVES